LILIFEQIKMPDNLKVKKLEAKSDIQSETFVSAQGGNFIIYDNCSRYYYFMYPPII